MRVVVVMRKMKVLVMVADVPQLKENITDQKNGWILPPGYIMHRENGRAGGAHLQGHVDRVEDDVRREGWLSATMMEQM